MPEGDTVWRAANRLNAALAGQRITRAELRHPRWAEVDLGGRLVTEVVSRGKHLLMRTVIDGGEPLTLHTHLGMEGSWWLYRPGEGWRGGQRHEIRVLLVAPQITAVGYRLRKVTVVPTVKESELVGHLGPDLLGADWDPGEALRRLEAQPNRAIGVALLDQRNLAGIGNLYRAEVLFLRGVSPWTPVGEVADLPAMVDLSHRLLDANRRQPEQTTTGSLRRGEQHWVYRRAGQPCRRCGSRVRSADIGDDPEYRRTYWCPRCQPGPNPSNAGPARLAGA